MSKQIHLDAPNIGRSEIKHLEDAINSGYVSTAGPFVGEFEKRFADYMELEGAVSTQSGTSAIHMALHELGIGPADEVIVPALTFVATINPVIYTGATPVFVDVDIDTWNIKAEEIEKSITEKTRAIIPVHLYGNPCAMDALTDLAKRHSLYIIEDATESLGARYKGVQTGTIGDFGCFSFNGNKIITTGGGGMIIGRDQKTLEHIRFLVNQARDHSEDYYHPEIGFNYRMTNIEAALGLAQIGRLDQFLAKKRRFQAIYREELEGVDSIRFQKECDGGESSFWLSSILLENAADIADLQKSLQKKGVPVRRVFMPAADFPPYRSYNRSNLANTRRIYERGLCLPGSTLNSEEDIRYVAKTIKECLGGGLR